MAKFPTIEEFVQQVKERVLAECLIDGEPLGELIDSGDLVHVCRCKDCTRNPNNGMARTICPCPMDRYMGDEGFCSKAEPKEDNK